MQYCGKVATGIKKKHKIVFLNKIIHCILLKITQSSLTYVLMNNRILVYNKQENVYPGGGYG